MDGPVDAAEFSAVQLREWSRRLGLSTNGTKSALAARINNIPATDRGEVPQSNLAEVEENSNTTNDEYESGGDDSADERSQQVNVDVTGKRAPKQLRKSKEIILYEKEIELLKREQEILKKENELLRKAAELNLKTIGKNDSETGEGERTSEATGMKRTVREFETGQKLALWKEMLPDFDGSVSVDVWLLQLENVQQVYEIDELMLHTLFVAKLKGKVQEWLHSKPNFLRDSVADLCVQLKEMFGSNENRMAIRKRFEQRNWKATETFVEYFNEKVRLAAGLDMDEEEFVEYVVEGFTDDTMRLYAHVQSFTTKAGLLKAFSKMTQRRPQTTTVTRMSPSRNKPSTSSGAANNRQAVVRCYNCNSVGHFAADCRKPKREYGACYACGVKGHVVAACPDRKSAVHAVDEIENEYTAS